MPVFQDALHYALTLLRHGRLRLDELCSVMALYGARTLRGESFADPSTPSAELIDDIVREVIQGEASSQILVASDLMPLADLASSLPGAPAVAFMDTAPHRSSAAVPSSDEIQAMGEDWNNLDTDPGNRTDLEGLQSEATDLGEKGFQPPDARRLILRGAQQVTQRPKTRTRLAQFYTAHGIEPTVSPGLDRDGPAIDGPGTTQYSVGGPIGEGGAGHVLLGVDRDLRRSVAIKVLHDKHRSNPLLLRAFIEEAIITGGLEHPNIVPVYHLGFNDELGPYYVMKRLDGLTLGSALQGLRRQDPEMEARFDLDRLLQIFIEVCQGVIYAHDRQVIHCDLKPNNILIGHYGEVLLVDWGLAFVMGNEGAQQARAQFWSGTPGFMAPEQVIGDIGQYDARTDVWALGGLLYAMLCLSRPFVGRTKQETLDAVMTGELVPPSRRNPGRKVPEGLERITIRAMSKRKEDRYPSVNELMAEVENHLAGRRRLRQRVELGQRALSDMRRQLDGLPSTEAVVDALQHKIMDANAAARDPARAAGKQPPPVNEWRRDLQELRETLAVAYKEAVHIGVEALEAGAHHPPLDALVGDLYWRVFKRLYPARVPAHRQVQALATDMLKKVAESALHAIAVQGKRLIAGGDEAPPLPVDLMAAIPDPSAAVPTPGGAGPTVGSGTNDPWLEAVLAYCGPNAQAPDADRDGVAAQLGRRLAFLKDVSLFQDVPGIELLGIAEACEKRTFKAQTAIFNEGDFGDSLYIVIEGVVNIVRGNAVINTVGTSRCLGEIAIIDGVTRTAGAVCATDVTVYRLSADKFRAIVRDNGTVALGVMRVLAQRLREATAREEALRQVHSRRSTLG
ncbi:MAG: protein kinase [Deltaproteobacteria bacterium]|nr:protein kinase [Deltaproteobacteria bacterium]